MPVVPVGSRARRDYPTATRRSGHAGGPSHPKATRHIAGRPVTSQGDPSHRRATRHIAPASLVREEKPFAVCFQWPGTSQKGVIVVLAVDKYCKDYIAGCQAKVRAQIKAYKAVATAATGARSRSLGSSLERFESVFFNNMVIVMDSYFVHRTRKFELKDGNPLNEVRILSSSLMVNDGRMSADSTIKMKAADSVLGYEVGDTIALTEKDFVQLAGLFFAEMEVKFA
jgi:hypothetical protein